MASLGGGGGSATKAMANGRLAAFKLYKSIFRMHRFLPSDMRALGDSYVRDEFKAHKSANPQQLMKFYSEWNFYLATLQTQLKPQLEQFQQQRQREQQLLQQQREQDAKNYDSKATIPNYVSVGLNLSESKQRQLNEDQRSKLEKMESELQEAKRKMEQELKEAEERLQQSSSSSSSSTTTTSTTTTTTTS